jgi:lysophospholipase L1-like esterase
VTVPTRLLHTLPLAVLLASCGSSSTPGGSGTLNATVFYDENGNGVMDTEEFVRFPGAEVDVGTLSGLSQANGDVAIAGVPGGIASVSVKASTLPPYYEMGTPLSVQVPQETANPLAIPVTLPIGTNTPNTYMAFGDSITIGDGSTDGTGYRGPLQGQLRAHLEAADSRCAPPPASPAPSPAPDVCPTVILDQGVEATRTNKGAARIGASLAATTPAFVLIHYGTNDWNEGQCRAAPPCYTIDNLRIIVEAAKANKSFPFLATIIPVNVGFSNGLAPPERQVWVHNQDILIKQLAAQEGVVLVDLETALLNAFAQNGGNYSVFFSDHVHPSDMGYAVMTKTFFQAITQRAPPAAAMGAFALRDPSVAPDPLAPTP